MAIPPRLLCILSVFGIVSASEFVSVSADGTIDMVSPPQSETVDVEVDTILIRVSGCDQRHSQLSVNFKSLIHITAP